LPPALREIASMIGAKSVPGLANTYSMPRSGQTPDIGFRRNFLLDCVGHGGFLWR